VLALAAACLLGVAAALVAPPPAVAAPPERGVLVPGQSLGGLRLGMTKSQVKAHWGTSFGRCRRCFYDTWYFNYRPFEPQGAGVEFELGKVRRIFTVWEPPGWRTGGGLALGAPIDDVTDAYGSLPRKQCLRYEALLLRTSGAVTVFYSYDDRLWGFGLMRPDLAACV
jgi:hypothetical protein